MLFRANAGYNTFMDIEEHSNIDAHSVSLSTPPRPRIWPVFVAPLVALLGAIASQFAIAGVIAAREISLGTKPTELAQRLPDLFTHPGWFILLAGGGQLAFAAAAIVPARWSRTPALERLGFVPLRQSWTIYPLTMLGSLAPLGVGMGAAHLMAQVVTPDASVVALFEKMTPLWGVAFVLFIAFAPGFFEEMLFRGYMQRRLLQRWRPWTAITVTSLIFAIVHVTPHAVVLAFPLGLWLGAIAWRTGSIGPCVACHAFVNGGVNTWRMVVKFGDVSEPIQNAVVITALVIGSVCFIVVCRRLAYSSL